LPPDAAELKEYEAIVKKAMKESFHEYQPKEN
jgi:hypothetical protein